MALSGSTDISYTASQIINAALRQCGIGLNGETPTAQETNDTLQALNMIIKAWGPKGLKLWARKTQSITLVASDADYTIGPTGDVAVARPLDIVSAFRRDTNSIDTPLTAMSREEYRSLSNKSQTGTPINYYYDRQLTSGVLYLWPVPDATAVSNYTVNINYRKPLDDLDATTDDIEIPQEWYRALKWNLAHEMSLEFDLPQNKIALLERKAGMALEEAETADIEDEVSIFFQVDKR